jgi:lipoprotein-anchoring transpeptidase ErfK/SrfK
METTQPADRAQRQPQQRRRRWWRFDRNMLSGLLIGMVAGLVISALLLGGVIVVGVYGYFQWFGLILPGVHVGDVALRGMTVEEATLELHEAWNAEQGIALSDGEHRWYAPPSDLGLSFDPAATAQRAYNVGHGQDPISEMLTMFDSILNGTAVVPVVQVDVAAARSGLNAQAETINLPPQEASIRFAGGQVVVVPGVPGNMLDVEATLAMLVADPGAALRDGYLPLVMVRVAPRNQDIGNAQAEAERLLDLDLTIQGYDPITDEHMQWTASREVIASWLTVTDGAAGPAVVVDEGRLAAYIGDLGAALGDGQRFDAEESIPLIETALMSDSTGTLVVKHPPTIYTVQPGDTLTSVAWEVGVPGWRILAANPGLGADALSVGQALTVPSKDDLLPLPVVVNKRIVVSISQQRLWVYEEGKLLHEYVISTGIDRSPTQPGVFQVQTHEPSAYASVWDLTMPHFLGIYEAWPGFMNGLHGLPTLSNGQTLWADILGRPASYGCIILDLGDAETLYNWTEEGVVVEIIE